MASYDSPGFMDKTPYGPVSETTGAPGSQPGPYPATDSVPDSLSAGTLGANAVVTPPGGSLVNADRVEVHPWDTLAGTQAKVYSSAQDPLTGIGAALGQTGAGMGSTTSKHPNAEAMPS